MRVLYRRLISRELTPEIVSLLHNAIKGITRWCSNLK